MIGEKLLKYGGRLLGILALASCGNNNPSVEQQTLDSIRLKTTQGISGTLLTVPPSGFNYDEQPAIQGTVPPGIKVTIDQKLGNQGAFPPGGLIYPPNEEGQVVNEPISFPTDETTYQVVVEKTTTEATSKLTKELGIHFEECPTVPSPENAPLADLFSKANFVFKTHLPGCNGYLLVLPDDIHRARFKHEAETQPNASYTAVTIAISNKVYSDFLNGYQTATGTIMHEVMHLKDMLDNKNKHFHVGDAGKIFDAYSIDGPYYNSPIEGAAEGGKQKWVDNILSKNPNSLQTGYKVSPTFTQSIKSYIDDKTVAPKNFSNMPPPKAYEINPNKFSELMPEALEKKYNLPSETIVF